MRHSIRGIRPYSVNDQIRFVKFKFRKIGRPFIFGEFYLKLEAGKEIRNDVANIAMWPADQLNLVLCLILFHRATKPVLIGSPTVGWQA